MLAACRQQPDQPVYPYLLGVLLERVGQWPLTSRPRWAYDQAEGYYDRARQLQQRQPPGTYDRQHYLRPSVALLRLSLRRVDHDTRHVELRLARPMRDPARILPLFARGVAGVDAGFGIDQLRLEAIDTEPLAPRQISPDGAPRQDRLDDLMASALEAGAGGISLGLMYEPDRYAPYEELRRAADRFPVPRRCRRDSR